MYSIYKMYYSETLLWEHTHSELVWISSVQTYAMLSTSIASGLLADRLGLRVILWLSTAVYVSAVLVVSFCAKYWQFLPC